MRLRGKIILLLFLFLLPAAPVSLAQDNSGTVKAPPTSRSQRKAEKKKWKETRKRKRRAEKAIKKHHKRIQSKDTNKRMKKNLKTANRTNENRKEFFLVRWFKKKK